MEKKKETVYLYGILAKYEINDKYSIIFDATKRKAYTDLWDSHNNNAKDDNFNFNDDNEYMIYRNIYEYLMKIKWNMMIC